MADDPQKTTPDVDPDKLKSQVENAEKLLGKWADELGKKREQIDQSLSKLEQLQKSLEEKDGTLQEKLKKIDETLDTLTKNVHVDSKPADGSGDTSGSKEPELTPEQRKAADEIYRQLKVKDPDKARLIYENAAERKKFLEAAREAVHVLPDSLFGDNEKNNSSSDNQYRRLFGLLEKESSAAPGSPERRPAGVNTNRQDGSESMFTPDGRLIRPEARGGGK